MRKLITFLLLAAGLSLMQAQPVAKNRAFFEGITYQWPMNAANPQTSTLADVATDPDQIIAMLREVYSNRTVPGTLTRGYSALNAPETQWPVAYPAIGTLAAEGDGYAYADTYGWNLPGEVTHVSDNAEASVSFVAGVDKGDNSSHTAMAKGAFHINYISNMGLTSYYLMSYGYDHRFSTDPGFVMTNVAFTFTAAGYGSSNIDYVRYRNSDGAMVRIDRNTTPSVTEFMPAGGTEFVWTIPTDSLVIRTTSNQNLRATRIDVTYRANLDDYHFAPSAYTPLQEGTTLLLLEVKDGMTVAGLIEQGLATADDDGKFVDYAVTGYDDLRALVAATIKSARVLTDAKRTGEGLAAGTLFKIDADKLNRFYLIGKGQLRWFNNDYAANDVNATKPPRLHNGFNDQQPYLIGGKYYDQSIEALFGHMFEQFSPAASTGGVARNDIYRDMVNMESFGVRHDCIDVVSAEGIGHEFNMYGKESVSADCQDVRDLMFFVPDYRMLAHDGTSTQSARDPNKAQRYVNYNPNYAPTMALFVIHQNPITGEQVDGEQAYALQLSWTSNLLDFLSGDDAIYELLRVTTDGDGNESYTPVATLDGNTLTYTDVVPMQSTGQVVTYAVRGQDAEHFLALQLSNKESFVIPGINQDELLRLEPNANYWSRFDPATEQNYYSNALELSNTSAGLRQLAVGDKLCYYRQAAGSSEWTPVATAEVTTAGQATVTTTNQRDEAEYPYGYNANATTPLPYSTDANGYIVFGTSARPFVVYDNFAASVAGNEHPTSYAYKVELVPAGASEANAHSNEMSIRVHKTALTLDPDGLRSASAADVETDTDHSLATGGDVEFDLEVKYSSKSEILRYDAYRWAEGEQPHIIKPNSTADTEQDVPPTGIAGNQVDYYTVAMNADEWLTTGTATFMDGATTTQARFTDSYASATPGAYTYGAVVEVFPPRDTRADYNTYGAPLRSTANGELEVSVIDPVADSEYAGTLMSNYSWTADGLPYVYYTVYLRVDRCNIPTGYGIAKLRAWRKADPAVLGEEDPTLAYRLGNGQGELLYEELTDVTLTPGQVLGTSPVEGHQDVIAATFGARKLRTDARETGVIESLTTDFVVRAYVAPLQTGGSGAPRRAEGDDVQYVVIESTASHTFISDVVTGVSTVKADRQVTATTYYNVAGIASKRPFAGVNIVVTRYTDGTTTTKKVMNN